MGGSIIFSNVEDIVQRGNKNMIKSTIFSLLCFLLISSGISQADDDAPFDDHTLKLVPSQPPQAKTLQNRRAYGQPFLATKKIICNDSKVIYNFLKNKPKPQVPIFFGLIKNEHGVATMMTQIFIGKNNKSFSIIESNSVGISCIISSGGEYDIMPHYHEGDVKKGRMREANKPPRQLLEEVRRKE